MAGDKKEPEKGNPSRARRFRGISDSELEESDQVAEKLIQLFLPEVDPHVLPSPSDLEVLPTRLAARLVRQLQQQLRAPA